MTPAGRRTDPRTDRRRLLVGIGSGLAVGLAGCLSGDDGDGGDASPETTTDPSTTDPDDPGPGAADGTTADGESTATEGETTTGDADATRTTTGDRNTTTTSEGETTATTTPGALDLREANVTRVRFERRDGDVRFSVTLYHDDDGEAGYANWWQVETLGGERLGRRDLLHAHGTREFTRSATVGIPDGTTRVVVRGHDETHGYGGQAAVVDLGTGGVEFVRQGPDPDSFTDRTFLAGPEPSR